MTDIGPPHVPRVRVLVVNYRSGPWLQRCLASLQSQTMQDFEAVVVDNASGDDSFRLPQGDPRFFPMPQPENLGFAAGNNLAALGAQSPWLALLNPDAEAEPDWLAELLAESERRPDCVIFGSTQRRADHPEILDGTGDCLSAYGLAWRSGFGKHTTAIIPEGEIFAACGAAMMIRRDWFERLGGFDERFFCYVEDVDLCFRARLQGARVWQSARAVVHHAGGVSGASGASAFSIRLGYRNLCWMLLRNLPAPLMPIALAGYLGVVVLMLLRPRRDHSPRAAFLEGAVAGIAGWRECWQLRKPTQSQRTVGWIAFAACLSWNPLDAALRRPVLLSSRRRHPLPQSDAAH